MSTVRFFVDSIEEGVATLIYDEEHDEGVIDLPASLLPEGTGEGDCILATFSIDDEESARMKHETDDLYAELGDAAL